MVMREPIACPYAHMINGGWRELDINGNIVQDEKSVRCGD